MFKVNNKDIKATTLARCGPALFIVNFEHISHLLLMFILVAMSKQLFPGLVFFPAVFFRKGEN